MYATIGDMIARFGEPEMVRLSVPDDRTAQRVNSARIETALRDAATLIDDHLRNRYRLPIEVPPDSIVRANCVLARYDLAQGERSEPTEQMRLARKEVIVWLGQLATGQVAIDAPTIGAGHPSAAGARASDRGRAFSDDELRGW